MRDKRAHYGRLRSRLDKLVAAIRLNEKLDDEQEVEYIADAVQLVGTLLIDIAQSLWQITERR